MFAVELFVARSQRQSRRAALVGLAVFVGIAGALSMSLIAGARRSSSVVDRFIAAAPQYDLGVYSLTLERPAVMSLPGVVRANPSGYLATNVVDASGNVVGFVDSLTADFTAPDDPTLRVLKGEMPDGSDPFETVVNESFAQNLGISVGDRVNVKMFSPDERESVEQGIYDPTGPSYEMTVAAVVRPPSDIVLDEPVTTASRHTGNEMIFSYDFWEQHRTEFLEFGMEYQLVLADGEDAIPSVIAALPSLVGPGEDPPFVGPVENFSRRASFDTPVNLETTALLALGLGVAMIAGVTMVLLVRTEQRFHDRDMPGLRALGVTAPQLAVVGALRVLPAALCGGAIAVVGAIALSNRFPIGIGRQLELDTGLQVDIAVVALGTVLAMVLVEGVSMLVSGSRARTSTATTSPFAVTGWLRRAGAPSEVTLGAHVAFENAHGRRSSTTAQGVFGGVIALIVVGALGMWLGGVDRLYRNPDRHGWPWDAAIGNTNFPLAPETADRLAADPLIAEQTRGLYGQAALDGVSSELFAFDAAGTAPPTIVDGRLPTAPNEIAVGTRAQVRLGAEIGDTVVMSLADSEFDPSAATPDVELTVVGTALAPMFGETDVGDASVVTLDAIRNGGGDPSPRMVMVRFAGPDQSTVAAEVDQEYTEDELLDIIPARVVNMHRVSSLPVLGMLLAGVLGTLTLDYVVVAGARIHRRELAVLRALGLDSKPMRRVLACQGVLTAVVTLVIGLPLALIVGNVLWSRVADDTGVQPDAVVPPQVLLLVPATLVAAVAGSLIADIRVRRSRVAELLREE